jgi:hypothetical protein
MIRRVSEYASGHIGGGEEVIIIFRELWASDERYR